VRPPDPHPNQAGRLTELPHRPGTYRTLVRIDEPGAWDLRLDARQQALRFVHAARLMVPPGEALPAGRTP
ncbi:MAG: hypothetical protein KBA95_05400, partial [Acidobacteria bacterium]|nr:hypothetical protein [Acidobacteriota bacterium]